MATSVNDTSTEKAKEEIKPWIRRFARFGYMAKGFVFALIGILAFMAAIGVGGKTTGTTGMLRSIARVRFGEIVLWLIGIGIIWYIAWLFIKAIKDPDNKGTDMKGIFTRLAYIVTGLIYSGIAFNAIKIAMHAGGSSGDSTKTMSAKLLAQPFGQWIVAIIGLIVIIYGLTELIGGITGKFMKKLHLEDMDDHEKHITKKAGRFGLIARGIVLGMIGYFFIQTARTANSSNAKGLDAALSELAQTAYGPIVLGVVAIGLFLYGVYQFAKGRYQHMHFGKNE